MPVPIGFYDATLVWQCTGVPRQSTCSIGFNSPLDPGGPSAVEVADIVYDAATAAGSICDPVNIETAWSFLGVSVSKMLADGPQVGQHFETVAGSGTGTPVPINCAVLVSKQTAAGGRRNRGRMFMPPYVPNETNVNAAGQLVSGDVTALNEYWTTFLQECVDGDLVPFLYHQSGDQTPTAITGVVVSGLLATQRRRMRS